MKTSRSLTVRLIAVAICSGATLALTGCEDRSENTPSPSGKAASLAAASILPLGQAPAVPTPPAEEPAPSIVMGEITSVSSDALDIKSQSSGNVTSVKLTDETRITIDGKEGTADDLKSGQMAVVSTESKEGELVAASVSART